MQRGTVDVCFQSFISIRLMRLQDRQSCHLIGTRGRKLGTLGQDELLLAYQRSAEAAWATLSVQYATTYPLHAPRM